MKLHRIRIRNFRLLADIELVLDDHTTVVVGRNNSGKTSLSELFRRFLSDSSPRFQIEDFSNTSYARFCEALKAKCDGESEDEIRSKIPSIELQMHFQYDPTKPELGPLSEFVIDLDLDCKEAVVIVRYELRDGAIEELFEGQPAEELTDATRRSFFDSLRKRIPSLFNTKVWAQDPNDSSNRKQMPLASISSLLGSDFVNAQRGLDDNTSRESDVLAKILEGLFSTATLPTANADDRVIADELLAAVQGVQQEIDQEFASKVKGLIPALKTFGYPGLGGHELETEIQLDVNGLLSNHTKIKYSGHNGVNLPESYNGLGMRNLIFILFQIVGAYRSFRAEEGSPGIHLIFIEEPEAHLHPQMQEVFIRQLSKLVDQLNATQPDEVPWPVQFVVSTHSSHVANEAGFETIRYFLATSAEKVGGVRLTKVKDLGSGLKTTSQPHKDFLRQYLTLTRCDLFFADKAVIVEGTSERLLLPVMIRKLEEKEPLLPKLSSQYMTVMEVGGAYAHYFFELLEFLELQSLIITDFDSVDAPGGSACEVSKGVATSNECLKSWFGGGDCSPSGLLGKPDSEKVKNRLRLAFQRPEVESGPCGRTLEDSLMLANATLFEIQGPTPVELEECAKAKADKVKKSQFALKYSIDETDWATPGYILDGLKWLARDLAPALQPEGVLDEEDATSPATPGGVEND